jgi:hypothetical protein
VRDDRLLVPIELPPLTGSELRRLFLRLPALRALPQQDRTVVARAIGGHPRLIEFVDALLRGGRTELRDTARKLGALAREHRLDLRRPRALDDALDDAVLLGAADILLTDLTEGCSPTTNGIYSARQRLSEPAHHRRPVARLRR